MTTRWTSSIALAVLGCVLATSAPVANGEEAKGPVLICAQTVYLHDPIDGYHRLTIIGELGGKGALVLDPNRCGTNEHGDTAGCTEIAEKVVSVAIKDTLKPDPAHQGRKLYALEGTGLANPLFLVIWPNASQPARLVHNDRGPNAPRPITLELLPCITKGDRASPVELCAAQYWAVQAPKEVLIFAAGVHPTPGYRTFFQQSPIDVYPPEYRLMHLKPTGPVVIQLVTPFTQNTSFPAAGTVKRVIVHDAKGKHEVPVVQLAP